MKPAPEREAPAPALARVVTKGRPAAKRKNLRGPEDLLKSIDLPPALVPPVMLARQARGEGRQARGPQAPAAGGPVSCAV